MSAATYPEAPGWKGQETSRAAAEFVAPSAGRMMDRVESDLRANGPASPEEITARIAAPGERLLLTSIRARVCQLRNLGRIVDAGSRGLGESRRVKVIRWRVATPDELSLFLARKAAEAEKGEAAHG
jgi:hypothetical protein